MIFVTVGTHQQQFDRLLKAVDALGLEEELIYQTGHCTYQPAKGECHTFIEPSRQLELMKAARVVISSAGTGSVMSILELGKSPVVCARLKKFGEHVDDHQIELVDSLESVGLVVAYRDGSDMKQVIETAAQNSRHRAIEPDARLVSFLEKKIVESAA